MVDRELCIPFGPGRRGGDKTHPFTSSGAWSCPSGSVLCPLLLAEEVWARPPALRPKKPVPSVCAVKVEMIEVVLLGQ
jgi:hypothetical protein